MLALLRCRCALLALTAACCALISLPSQSQAGIFLDVNFDGLTNGQAIPTTTPSVDPIPIHRVYSTGGFPDSIPYTGTNNVTSGIGNMSNAVLMSTTQAGTGANFIDTQFLVSGDRISLDFDLRIVAQSADLYPQASDGAPNGQLFAINAFALDSNRVFRFAVAPTSANGGFFALRDDHTAMGDLKQFVAYTVGTDYHVSIVADYLTNTVDAMVTWANGSSSLTDVSFIAPQSVNGGMSEFFIFQNNIAGVENTVALDNIVGATIAAVPEPSSLAIFALGSLCCAGLARRRERSTIAR